MEDLKLLYKDIANVYIYMEDSVIGFCGTCSPLYSTNYNLCCEIKEPKSFDKLKLLLDSSKFNVYIKFAKDELKDLVLYKKDGFDKAFEAMKLLKPKLTEFNFAFTCGFNTHGEDEPDYDLVEEIIYQDNNCENYIHNDDGSLFIYSGYLKSHSKIEEILIKIPQEDIKSNLDKIHKIISTQL